MEREERNWKTRAFWVCLGVVTLWYLSEYGLKQQNLSFLDWLVDVAPQRTAQVIKASPFETAGAQLEDTFKTATHHELDELIDDLNGLFSEP